MRKIKTDVCVIGGGAAGLMTALSASDSGAAVLVLEKQPRPAMKLRITGKGRCNICNDCQPEDVLRNVTRNSRFLNSAIHSFPPSETISFFEDLGIPLKTERGNRVFPVSDKASDVSSALIAAVEQCSQIEHLHAKEILSDGSNVSGVRCDDAIVECKAAVICTGGLSYPATGSTGDGYKLASALGHCILPLSPSLVPLTSPDGDCALMQGLSLKNITLTLRRNDGKIVWSELGEMQFTHFGISGPLVLSASAHLNDVSGYSVEIDLKPGLTEEKLDARLLRVFTENTNRDFRNALDSLLPKSLIPVVVRRSGIAPETKVHDITRAQRGCLRNTLKRFIIPVNGTRPVSEAVVTRGGVSVKELNPSTMESRLVSGLFFAGEVIDLDAYTGGFNLQIAWSTGRLAGRSAAEYAQRSL